MGRCAITILELKKQYNKNLNRYYNADKYLQKNINEVEYYIDETIKIKENIEMLLNEILKIQEVKTNEILGGFKIE